MLPSPSGGSAESNAISTRKISLISRLRYKLSYNPPPLPASASTQGKIESCSVPPVDRSSDLRFVPFVLPISFSEQPNMSLKRVPSESSIDLRPTKRNRSEASSYAPSEASVSSIPDFVLSASAKPLLVCATHCQPYRLAHSRFRP